MAHGVRALYTTCHRWRRRSGRRPTQTSSGLQLAKAIPGLQHQGSAEQTTLLSLNHHIGIEEVVTGALLSSTPACFCQRRACRNQDNIPLLSAHINPQRRYIQSTALCYLNLPVLTDHHHQSKLKARQRSSLAMISRLSIKLYAEGISAKADQILVVAAQTAHIQSIRPAAVVDDMRENSLRDQVEVASANPLMLDRGMPSFSQANSASWRRNVGRHALIAIAARQLEHAVVQGVRPARVMNWTCSPSRQVRWKVAIVASHQVRHG